MLCKLTLEQICTMTESPLFDRKSARIDAKTLAIHLIAFANADGGVIAVGVEDDGTITGIDGYQEHINELLRVPFDYCKPSVQIETELLACTNGDGEPDYILLIEVLQSNELHANQADDVFFRVGDKSKKLNFDERLQLMYAKGTRYFEDTPVPDAAMEDIDLDFVREYTQKLGYRKSPEEYLRENKEFISTKGGKEEVSTAAMLLFGKNPKHYFPRARIRFVRYEGTEAKVGAEMNVIKDVVFEGRVLQVIEKALEFVQGAHLPRCGYPLCHRAGIPGVCLERADRQRRRAPRLQHQGNGHSNQDVRRPADSRKPRYAARHRAAEQYAARPLLPQSENCAVPA